MSFDPGFFIREGEISFGCAGEVHMPELTVGIDLVHNFAHRHEITAQGLLCLGSVSPTCMPQHLRRWPLMKGCQKLFHDQMIIRCMLRLCQRGIAKLYRHPKATAEPMDDLREYLRAVAVHHRLS